MSSSVGRRGASPQVRAGYTRLIDILHRRGFADDAHAVAELAVRQGVWADPHQRPVDFDPLASRRPVYDPGEFWFVPLLREAHARIRAEIDAVAGADAHGFTSVEEPLVDGGRWDQVILYDGGRRQERGCATFPVTAAVVEQIPEATTLGPGVVTLSWLVPGTHIVPHCGTANTQLRVHLGITTPDGPVLRVGPEELRWSAGECLVFDDSYEHEVHHRGSMPRVVLLLDIPYPGLDEAARRRALNSRRAPSAQVAGFLAEHDLERIETDAAGVILRPGRGTDALIRRYLEETGAAAVELRDGRLRFE